jgi:excisionase family DNA binding protein
MTAHDTTTHDDWLSLQEASDLLGVATSTLRRWGDTGRVPMKRTLGGHRRFARAAVEKLVGRRQPPAGLVQHAAPAPYAGGESKGGWGVYERDLARQEWHARLATKAHTDHMRGLGQRLLGLLIQYVNRREDDGRFLSEARAVGANYGRETREANVTMHDTVAAFLFFRNAFSEMAMPIPGVAQPTDLDEAVALQKRINRFMDATLLGLIGGYEGEPAEGT